MDCDAHLNSLCAHYVTFGLVNGLLEPNAREINTSSRKGSTIGQLVLKWQALGIISSDLLQAKTLG